MPFTIFIKDGIAYWYRDFTYEDVLKKYIDNEGYFKSTTAFKQPARFITPQLYLYSYPRKWIKAEYRMNWEAWARVHWFNINKKLGRQ